MKRRSLWLSIRTPLTPRRAALAKFAAFFLPVAIWCVVSYVPFIAHPMVRVTDAGDSIIYSANGSPMARADFEAENGRLAAAGKRRMVGEPANPVYLPAPHEVAVAFYQALTTPPVLKGDQWVVQSLWESCQIIFWGFLLSAIPGVPLGILCGTFDFPSKLSEPFIDFIRYMPAPAFGVLCAAAFGVYGPGGPAIAIIWIGTFFQLVLVTANTTRQFDPSLLEAAQTLGANRRSLLTRVILPGILPNLYNDMRILIGWAWTYLIVGELIAQKIGISAFIQESNNHAHYANVYAGIIMIGLIGLTFDQFLAYAAKFLFPWQPSMHSGGLLGWLIRVVTYWPKRLLAARRPAVVAP
ncbi:MAG TPA: ABC transporter permease subunit [Gemmataceae bacterium]|nr:ABC transporter permease subunit [Gemmataceae bacterium]